MVNQHLPADQRKAIILTAAINVALRDGLWNVNYDTVANECVVKTARNTVKHYFGSRLSLWKKTIEFDKTGEVRRMAEENGIFL